MKEKQKIRIPVEVDDDGFSIDESRLDEALHKRIDILSDKELTHKRTNLRLFLASVLFISTIGVITTLIVYGATLTAVALIFMALVYSSDVAKWIIEGPKNRN